MTTTRIEVKLPHHEILYVGFDKDTAQRVKRQALTIGHPSVRIYRERVSGSLPKDKLFHYTVVCY